MHFAGVCAVDVIRGRWGHCVEVCVSIMLVCVSFMPVVTYLGVGGTGGGAGGSGGKRVRFVFSLDRENQLLSERRREEVREFSVVSSINNIMVQHTSQATCMDKARGHTDTIIIITCVNRIIHLKWQS